MMNSDILTIMQQHPLLTSLPPELLADLVDEVVHYSVGDVLFQQGEAAQSLFFVLDGETQMMMERSDGIADEVIVTLGTGHIIGADALNRDGLYVLTARAVKPTCAITLNSQRLLDVLDLDFTLTLSMLGEMAGSLRGQVKQITELKLQSTTERLASYLIGQTDRMQGPVLIRLACEKRTLADHLGMEPATLSRAFAKLRPYGVDATQPGVVEIDNIERLRDLCEECDMSPEGNIP